MNDWLDQAGTQIDEIKWNGKAWDISNAFLTSSAVMLGDALSLFEREWRELNE